MPKSVCKSVWIARPLVRDTKFSTRNPSKCTLSGDQTCCVSTLNGSLIDG